MPPQSKTKPQGKGRGDGPGPKSAPAPAPRAWRVNVRAVIVLGVALAAVVAALVTVQVVQARRGRPALLAQARKLVAAKPPEDALALSYLKEYLAINPRDIEALDLRSEVLSRVARSPDQIEEAIRSAEAALRQESAEAARRNEPDVKSPRGRALRRRLVEAYLRVGPMVAPSNRKYGLAETMAKELADSTGAAADLRLHALALERLALAGDPKAFARAAARLEEARALEPGDIAGSERLARIYFLMKQPEKAGAVLEALLKVSPTPASYLAAARFHASVAADAASSGRSAEVPALRTKVDDLIKRAVAAAPRDLAVRLEAASLALGARRPAEAAAHLDQVDEKDRQNYQYLTLRGVVALHENRATDAVDSWNRGLLNTGGTEAELSWKLAFVLLQLGRVDEADDLIKQYRRLVGNSAGGGGDLVPPEARFLEAVKLLKTNRPNDAIVELEKARLTIPAAIKPHFYLTLGNACEATRDDSKAMQAYDSAIQADPKFSAPRLARARLLQVAGRLDSARDEIRAGLAEMGDDPALLTALARLELDRQRRLPAAKRTWGDLQAILDQGRKVAPGSGSLAVVRASALTLQGKPEAANDLLRDAVRIDKTDPDLWIARAEKEVALGRLDQALLVLDQAMDPKAAGDTAALRTLRARILTVRGHGAEARDELVRDLERVRPDQRPRLWMALGELYMAQGDPKSLKSARKAFAEWARLLPDDPLPRLFVLELALADPSDDGKAAVEESLEVLGRASGYYANVGRATYLLHGLGPDDDKAAPRDAAAEKARNGRLADAERLIDKIEAAAPQLRFGYLLRGQLMSRRGDLPAAAAAYEKALAAEGGRVLALPRLIATYTAMGEKGRAGLERLQTDNPEAAQGIARAEAEAAARQGKKELAETLARQVVVGNPESLDLRVWQARLLNTLGKPEEAEKTLRDLVAKHPETLGPWMALLYFQVSRKDQAGAVKTVESMIGAVKDLERPELVWGQAWRVAGDRDRADKAFEAALERSPADPRVGRAAAEYFTATARPERAEAIFEAALKLDPAQRWATRGLALVLSGRPGDEASWRKSWDLVKEAAPGGDLPEDRLIRAIVLSRGPEAANRDASTAMLVKLVEDLPADLPAASMARGTLINGLMKADPSKAAELAAVDAQAANAGPAALSLHATALIAAGQLDDAGRQIDRLAIVAPDDAATMTLRARYARARGQGNETAAALEQAAPAKIAGPDGEAAGRLIVQTLMSELDQPEAALRVASLLLDKFPETAGVKAAVLARQGKREDALALYLKTIEAGNPRNVREAARNSLALITRDQFDPATIALAEKVIDAARVKDRTSSDLTAMAGYLRHFQGRYEDEVELYKEALAGQPDDFSLMNNLAWTLSEGQKKPEEGLAKINEAIKKSPSNAPQLLDTRGCIYTRLGRYPEAIRDLELSVHERPTALALAHLARAYYKAGRKEDFEKTRERVKKATPPLAPGGIEEAERAELTTLIFGEAK